MSKGSHGGKGKVNFHPSRVPGRTKFLTMLAVNKTFKRSKKRKLQKLNINKKGNWTT